MPSVLFCSLFCLCLFSISVLCCVSRSAMAHGLSTFRYLDPRFDLVRPEPPSVCVIIKVLTCCLLLVANCLLPLPAHRIAVQRSASHHMALHPQLMPEPMPCLALQWFVLLANAVLDHSGALPSSIPPYRVVVAVVAYYLNPPGSPTHSLARSCCPFPPTSASVPHPLTTGSRCYSAQSSLAHLRYSPQTCSVALPYLGLDQSHNKQ